MIEDEAAVQLEPQMPGHPASRTVLVIPGIELIDWSIVVRCARAISNLRLLFHGNGGGRGWASIAAFHSASAVGTVHWQASRTTTKTTEMNLYIARLDRQPDFIKNVYFSLSFR